MSVMLPDHLATLHERVQEIALLAARTNKATVLVVQQFPVVEDRGISFPPVRESVANLMAFVELGTASDLLAALTCAGSFNWIAVDCDDKLPESAAIVQMARAHVSSDRLLFYSDNQVWFDSALDMVQRLERGLSGKRVLVCGTGPLADRLAFTLAGIGATAVAAGSETSSLDVAVVLGASQKRESISRALIERLPADAAVYDLGIGNLSLDAADAARARGLRLYRLDNRAGVSSAVVRLLETDNMVTTVMGRARLRDVEVVAGGLLAGPGAIVVDDIRHPTVIFGVADGHGRFRQEPLGSEDCERVEYVRSLIARAAAAAPPRHR